MSIRLKKENDPARETGSNGREHDKKIKYDPAREGRVNREESVNILPSILSYAAVAITVKVPLVTAPTGTP